MKKIFLAFALLLAACGDETTQINQTGMDVVSSLDELPKCTADNEGEQALVKGESSVRVCVDGKWFATLNPVGDSASVVRDTVYVNGGDLSCATEELAEGAGLKIICNGDSIGVVFNGQAGKDRAQGIQGEKGDAGAEGSDGMGCTVVQDSVKITITCGDKTATINLDDGENSDVDTLILDPEKVATSLDEVSGVTQKGPFLSGSRVLVREMEDGRALTQTGNSFNGKILNDKGEFRITGRMLVSQYVMLEATGYYRNEITGENSSSELTLFAVSDVTTRNVVNVNLLTHLEYERVIYLVTKKKLTVTQAKRQAQREVFNILDIDATNFSSSEDLSIAGSSDEDGALLAFSIILQGNRSVSQLTELLTKISTDMEKDGTWDDSATRMAIADWSADADSADKLDVFRSNVAGWGLSAMVPNFEPFVRHFWNKEYGLDSCTADSIGRVKAATAGKTAGTKVRYICKDVDGLGDIRWVIADDFEKDTYGWSATNDGVVELGSVMQSSYYLYDSVAGTWRKANLMEQQLGGCTESVAGNKDKNTGFVNGFWYKCENRAWNRTSALIVDTQGWVPGSDGDIQRGDSTSAYYVFDLAENSWREASENDVNLGLMGCTTNRMGEVGRSETNNRYYSCAADHSWKLLVDKTAYNTIDYDCDADGKFVTGLVDIGTYFVCEDGMWREATAEEEQAGEACTTLLDGRFNRDSTRYCENRKFREANIYDFDVGVRNYFNPDVEYGELVDERDGRTYRTVTINGLTVMAENLNYGDEKTHSYLIDNNSCYKGDSINCLKGGRYYTWTAAMNIDSKWQGENVPKSYVNTPHQGICPAGWHIPTIAEWQTIGEEIDALDLIAIGNLGMDAATNATGFSVLLLGFVDFLDYSINYLGEEALFWSADENDGETANAWSVNNNVGKFASYGGYYKMYKASVRCARN